MAVKTSGRIAYWVRSLLVSTLAALVLFLVCWGLNGYNLNHSGKEIWYLIGPGIVTWVVCMGGFTGLAVLKGLEASWEELKRRHPMNPVVKFALAAGALVVVFLMSAPIRPLAREVSKRNACISNLKQINGAKAAWASDNRITNENAVVTGAVLYGPTNYIRDEPLCPSHGLYHIGLLVERPRCSVAGHTL